MATTKNEFVQLADEIFEEFADFIQIGTFSKTNSINRDENTKVKVTQPVQGIEIEYDEKVFGRELVKSGDYIQVYRYKSFVGWYPEIGNTTVEMGSIRSNIVNVNIDPAKAVIFLHVRRL
jgi:hypothetical protein